MTIVLVGLLLVQGGSWASSVEDCWEYCFGREDQVVQRLVEIVNQMGLDGVDIDYEYFYEDNQNGSGFSRGAEAQKFLKDVTVGLRDNLPSNIEISHAPMDSDLTPDKAYFDILKDTASSTDFLNPQYYNGITRPAIDGIAGTGAGSVSALSHYTELVNTIYGGDATKVVFGFCIADCGGTGSNVNGAQAAQIMTDLSTYYPCNGGAFFWVINDDVGGGWSDTVGAVIAPNAGCSSSPCYDALLDIDYQGQSLGCSDVSNFCSAFIEAQSHCPVTCGACAAYGCSDSLAPFSFGGATYTCGFLASQSQAVIDSYCANALAFTTCRATCGVCGP